MFGDKIQKKENLPYRWLTHLKWATMVAKIRPVRVTRGGWCCARLTRRFFKACAITRFRNQFARGQKTIGSHRTVFHECFVSAAKLFFLQLWREPECVTCWHTITNWVHFKRVSMGQPSNGPKINRQPSKTEYFYRQASNEGGKIGRQISQISLNDRDRLT